MSLRIAHVTATFPPYRGGTGNVCFHNARELARRGHQVHVFTAAVPDAPASESIDGVAVHRLRPLLRAGNAPLLPGLLPALRGFDLVHLHAPFILGAELTLVSAWINRAQLVVTYHNDLIATGTWRDLVFRLATWSGRRAVLGRANRVIFVSQGHAETSDQRLVYERRRPQCRILANGVDTAAFCPADDRRSTRSTVGLPPDRLVIGFVGGLDSAHHYKGLSVLLDALASPGLHEAHLLVVGDGDLLADYRQYAGAAGLSGRVHFYGGASHAVLPALYRACDLVAMPSLAPESFGLVVVEALACGIPVIASAGPGTLGLVQQGDDGLLVPPGDVAALAAALRELLADEPRRRAMGARGRAKVAAGYAWPAIGERLETIYYQLLDEAHPSRKGPVRLEWRPAQEESEERAS